MIKKPVTELLFESEQKKAGEGVLINLEKINHILERRPLPNLQLVFLSACHSEQIGKVFLQNGVPHVICIKQEDEVLDQAALDFTKSLY